VPFWKILARHMNLHPTAGEVLALVYKYRPAPDMNAASSNPPPRMQGLPEYEE
jgi:hypothetical protein